MAEKGGIIEGVLGGGELEAPEGDAATALDPIAAALAMGEVKPGGSLDPRLASYLVQQQKLVEVQTEHLHEQRELQLAHLRVRRWKDRLSLTLQGLGVALGVMVLIALGALAWQAHEDHGLVVQAFTAPPAFAARGVNGDTVAADLMGKLSTIASYVRENSFSSTGDVTTDRSGDVKIEIPETGVSLTEAWRLLREWLGSARKVSGNLRDEGGGRVTLTARLDDSETFTATGPASDLGALEQNIAEQVYGTTDPNNLAVYLEEHGRKADAFAAAARYALLARTREDRANAIVMWGDVSDDPGRKTLSGRIALRADPGLMSAHFNIASAAMTLEHPQEALLNARAMLSVSPADQPPQHRGAGAKQMRGFAHWMIDELTGDFAAAATARADFLPQPSARSERLLWDAVDAAWLHDPSGGLNMIAEAPVFGSAEPGLEQVARYWVDAERGDWAGALSQAQALAAMDQETIANSNDPDGKAGLKAKLERRDRPMLAVAEAHSGNLPGASALIASTPTDCDSCVRARGQIAALAGHRAESERWFAEAIAQGPDLPLAYTDRGRTRLEWGDIAGALSDAATANRLGPHFADALKLSGDALAGQGRWSEAVAQYNAALALAPAWAALSGARTTAQSHIR